MYVSIKSEIRNQFYKAFCEFTIEKDSGSNSQVIKMHRKSIYNLCQLPQC